MSNMPKRNHTSASFDAGVIYAAALICSMHDQPTIAKDILRESRVEPDLADSQDMEVLQRFKVIDSELRLTPGI